MMWYDLFGVSVHSVCANSEYGGMLAAAGFIRKGHRKLAVIASEPRNHDIVDRIAGFVQHYTLLHVYDRHVVEQVRIVFTDLDLPQLRLAEFL